MLCTNCGQHEATMHYQSNVNGKTTEAHLCSECASKMGYPSLFSGNTGGALGFDEMLSHLFSTEGKEAPKTADPCPLCGTTAEEISRTGRVGCARCYDTFSGILTPYIRRIHGNTYHSGHVPKSAGEEVRRRRRAEELSRELQQAIGAEEFERAASIRDELRALKEEGSSND